MKKIAILATALPLFVFVSIAQESETVSRAGLKTRWAAEIPAVPWPEYPRPQLTRPQWINLNGLWNYRIVPRGQARPDTFPGEIRVPYPLESQLSGVQGRLEPDQELWYHRTFKTTSQPAGSRWILHFGAADWEAEVFVNGRSVGTHRGGYTPFSFDVTDDLSGNGDQDLAVRIFDPTNSGFQPRGKQALKPGGIWYTAVSGIWQTVWLEAVPTAHVTEVAIVPDLDRSTVNVTVQHAGRRAEPFSITIRDDENGHIEKKGLTGTQLAIAIPSPKTWSPDHPHLYSVEIKLDTGDAVESYFGMRKIHHAPDEDGHIRLYLNNEVLFQYGPLDQGWWPDGLYTAPTDEALRFDVEQTKMMGFNMARKHVKVEPARWYYHCDRLGLLVWQDMPNGSNNGQEGEANFLTELDELVGHFSHFPSIVMWVPFNEAWGQHQTEAVAAHVKERDPSRLVNSVSGWTDKGVGDVLDIHRYPGPGIPDPSPGRALVLGEFGGLGLPVPGHLFQERDNWGYRNYQSTGELGQAYGDLIDQLHPLIGEGLAAAVYTQTTDVEIEVNGLMTYDRAVLKLTPELQNKNRVVYTPPPVITEIIPDSRTEPQRWKYTHVEPAEHWAESGFDDRSWATGWGGFGKKGTPGAYVRTPWLSRNIWIRRLFTLPDGPLSNPHLRIHHDEDADVYLNGQLVLSLEGYTSGYQLVRLPDAFFSALVRGQNTLAIHVKQTSGGQYIDAGIVDIRMR